jgi:hypothetical protein
MFAIPLLFACSEIDQIIEMPHVTFAQKLILKHRAKRWRERHGELEWHIVTDQTLHHAKQRNVTFCDCLKEPVFLEEMFMLRMPNKRKVSVQNESEVTGH